MDTEVEILLVEDNAGDAEMTIRELQRHRIGNHIVHLKDGADAIDFVFGTGIYENRNRGHKPKMILLDLRMPRVSGIEVLKTLKSDERSRTIPVVVLTASAEDPDIRTCYELGVNSYIVKPVGFENFTKAIAELGMYWLLLNNPPQ
ncbi:MAG: response regulator [Bacteroidetes bacterium]|nr:response regulator [Bacteroidota bacterium]